MLVQNNDQIEKAIYVVFIEIIFSIFK